MPPIHAAGRRLGRRPALSILLLALAPAAGLAASSAHSAPAFTLSSLPPDADGDGVADAIDNCLRAANPPKIAFTSTRDGNQEVYVMDADGSNPTRLTTNAALDLEPSFGGDGTKVVSATRPGGRGPAQADEQRGAGHPLRLGPGPHTVGEVSFSVRRNRSLGARRGRSIRSPPAKNNLSL